MRKPTHHRSITAMVIVTLLSTAMAVGCGSVATFAQTAQKKTFKIGMVTFAGYAPLYLAKEKHFFGDLDVQLQRIEDVPSIRAAVTKGDLNAYLATPDIALDTNTAPPGKAVWAIDESAGGDGVIVSGDIKTLQDLKGKVVGAEPGLPPHFVLMYLLFKNGMSLSDINLKDMSTQDAASAFVGGKLDGAGIYEPYLSQAKEQRAGSRVVISSAQTPGMIVDLIFASDTTIAKQPDEVKAVIAGWRKAMAFIKSNPDEAYPIMAKAFNLPLNEFKDAVSGINWLDLDENRKLFGTNETPGPLVQNFGVVVEVLKRNRPSAYPAKAATYLIGDFIN